MAADSCPAKEAEGEAWNDSTSIWPNDAPSCARLPCCCGASDSDPNAVTLSPDAAAPLGRGTAEAAPNALAYAGEVGSPPPLPPGAYPGCESIDMGEGVGCMDMGCTWPDCACTAGVSSPVRGAAPE